MANGMLQTWGMIQDTDLAHDVWHSQLSTSCIVSVPQVMPMSSASVPCHVLEMK